MTGEAGSDFAGAEAMKSKIGNISGAGENDRGEEEGDDSGVNSRDRPHERLFCTTPELLSGECSRDGSAPDPPSHKYNANSSGLFLSPSR